MRRRLLGGLLLAAYLLTLVLVVVIGIYTARGLARRTFHARLLLRSILD